MVRVAGSDGKPVTGLLFYNKLVGEIHFFEEAPEQ